MGGGGGRMVRRPVSGDLWKSEGWGNLPAILYVGKRVEGEGIPGVSCDVMPREYVIMKHAHRRHWQ
jgi:hypothetical protein